MYREALSARDKRIARRNYVVFCAGAVLVMAAIVTIATWLLSE